MQNFSFTESDLLKLKIIKPFYVEDTRGFFLKSFEKEIFRQNGVEYDIFEDFESFSKKGVIRGLHFQTNCPQSKIIRAITGNIFDVAVDLRKNSKTFGIWEGFYLSSENKNSLLVPCGFAHGFLVLSETALISYKCAGQYSKGTDSGIIWNDSDLHIDWPINDIKKITISDKDAHLQTFADFKNTTRTL